MPLSELNLEAEAEALAEDTLPPRLGAALEPVLEARLEPKADTSLDIFDLTRSRHKENCIERGETAERTRSAVAERSQAARDDLFIKMRHSTLSPGLVEAVEEVVAGSRISSTAAITERHAVHARAQATGKKNQSGKDEKKLEKRKAGALPKKMLR